MTGAFHIAEAAFPAALTTWPSNAPGMTAFSHFRFDRLAEWAALRGDNFALPLMSPSTVDAVTGATPLGNLKFGDDPVATPLLELLLGSTGGSLGETSALLILLGGIYLAIRGHLNWHIPVSILLSVFAFSWVFYALGLSPFSPTFMLLSGGLMLGAWYMATDMVTSPVTNLGCWVFGVGIGASFIIAFAAGPLIASKFGVQATYRTLDRYSPRYLPPGDLPEPEEGELYPDGLEEGHEWEIRTYVHLAI